MRVSRRSLLVGVLLCCGNHISPMEQALAALENDNTGNNPAEYSSGYPSVYNPASNHPSTPPAEVTPSSVPTPGMLPKAPASVMPPVPPHMPPPPAHVMPPVQEPAHVTPLPATRMTPHVVKHPQVLPPPVEPHPSPKNEEQGLPTQKPVQAKASLQIADVESGGLDTINIDSGGNWLEKRIWFKKAETLFDDIRKTVEQAADIRMDFVDAVNAIGKKTDNFYDAVSFDKGQLDELLKNTAHKVSDASAKREGDLSSKERSLEMSIHAEQKQIEQIGDDIKKVEEFDTQIDKAMGQAFKTINACRALESKAWDNFKAIGSELDDKKARVLYYEMENIHKNIEQHIRYLKGTLLPYLQNKLVAAADNIMMTISHSVKALEAKGIHLAALLNADEKKDIAVEQTRQEAKEKIVEEAWEKTEKAKEVQKEASEKSSQDEPVKKEHKEKVAWYMQFFVSIGNQLQQLGCFLRSAGCKIFEIAPGFFELVSRAVKTLWEFVVAFCSTLSCYFKCMVCSIKSWLCELFGK